MNRERVGEERGSKEMDRCPLTAMGESISHFCIGFIMKDYKQLCCLVVCLQTCRTEGHPHWG
jgi:hypothetical protein